MPAYGRRCDPAFRRLRALDARPHEISEPTCMAFGQVGAVVGVAAVAAVAFYEQAYARTDSPGCIA